MMDLLCLFGHRFPQLAAKILERERGKTRNFREETITDLLMAGLVPFESLQIMTDFPVNEAATGEDMDWEFVDEHALDGRVYLRLHIQAKRAHHSKTKKPYWLYRSLDHAVNPPHSKGTPKPPKGATKPSPQYGNQHKTLLDEAAKLGNCVPLYMFYHPASALASASGSLPAVEGVNWMFADLVPVNVSPKAWPIADKKLEKWRSYFQPLHRLLCFGHGIIPITVMRRPNTEFATLGIREGLVNPTPGELEDMLNGLRASYRGVRDLMPIRASRVVPPTTLTAIAAFREGGRMADIPRKRVIFVTSRPTDGHE